MGFRPSTITLLAMRCGSTDFKSISIRFHDPKRHARKLNGFDWSDPFIAIKESRASIMSACRGIIHTIQRP